MNATGDRIDLVLGTVNAIRRRLNLAARTVNATVDRKHAARGRRLLAERTVKVIGGRIHVP